MDGVSITIIVITTALTATVTLLVQTFWKQVYAWIRHSRLNTKKDNERKHSLGENVRSLNAIKARLEAERGNLVLNLKEKQDEIEKDKVRIGKIDIEIEQIEASISSLLDYPRESGKGGT